MTEWSEAKCLSLIELYKNKPVIWDPKDKDHFKKDLKVAAWREIGAAMGSTGDECKQKMVNILASWRREKAKEKKSGGSGKGRDRGYESRWYAFNALDFLKGRGTPSQEVTIDNSNIEDGGHRTSEESTSNIIAPSEEPALKKLRPDPKLQMLKEALDILKSAAERTPTTLVSEPEIKSFCDFIFYKMKNYSRQTMSCVQQEIMQTIFRADRESFGDPQFYGNSVPHTSGQQQYTPLSVMTTIQERSHHLNTYSKLFPIRRGSSDIKIEDSSVEMEISEQEVQELQKQEDPLSVASAVKIKTEPSDDRSCNSDAVIIKSEPSHDPGASPSSEVKTKETNEKEECSQLNDDGR